MTLHVGTVAAGSAPSTGERAAPAECEHTHPESERLGYLAWHEWADWMAKTHRQARCPGCGLFKVWVPVAGGRS